MKQTAHSKTNDQIYQQSGNLELGIPHNMAAYIHYIYSYMYITYGIHP